MMEDFSGHFCKGEKIWKPICFECKYPKEVRDEMLLKEIRAYQKKVTSNKNKIKNLAESLKRIIAERDFYKEGFTAAIKDIEWAKRETSSKRKLIDKLNKVLKNDAVHAISETEGKDDKK